ncbi:NACHT and WD repeat domain-containing protein [Sorangium sp. So ce1099]|uniref:NACHT and WD repeat domain-containing protein n=1 Tax=Sorangium sp. So ce1099 TaxID=3133331 RepID=UPI003F61FF8D
MSDPQESGNPFPGAQPYRAADRDRFFGRDALVAKLAHQILAHPSTTLYGPSGAGKSSLMQAGVIPRLEKTHDFRVVRVDGWPSSEAPLPWLTRAVFEGLELGVAPQDVRPLEALDQAMLLAERRSEQPILIYLDQIEQLLFSERTEAEALIDGVHRLARAPIQGLQIVLSLREDYLGRFRDRARDRQELLAHGFRLGPMTVDEMVKAVCRAAAEGQPPQRWDEEHLRGLMMEVRMPGEGASDAAEVQAVYAQIVCRALFQERAQGGAEGVFKAESILRRYFDATMKDLGPLATEAQRLLEDQLVTGDGSRTLRTEKELLGYVPEEKLKTILRALEDAAILHAQAHSGSRYFEIGHDWLASRVHEQRKQRERDAEQRRREEALEAERRRREEALEAERQRREEALEAERRRERDEAEARLAKLRILALAALAVAAITAGLGLWALEQEAKAERAKIDAVKAKIDADDARRFAETKEIEAYDARLLAGSRELKRRGQPAWATKLLVDVRNPDQARGWVALASEALATNMLEVTLRGRKHALRTAAWSSDGKRVLTTSSDNVARLWNADGTGDPEEVARHNAPITVASFSPDGQRVLTGSADGTARVRNADRSGQIVELVPAPSAPEAPRWPITAVAFSGDGKRVVVASTSPSSPDTPGRPSEVIARVLNADGTGSAVKFEDRTGPLTVVALHPDGKRVLTVSQDGTAKLWSADAPATPVVFKDHGGAVNFAALSPDGARLVTTSSDKTARIWDVSRATRPVVLKGHDGAVLHAAWDPGGTRVATTSNDDTARVWSADGKGEAVVLSGHSDDVVFVAFQPEGRYLATASLDQTVRIWPAQGGVPLVMSGHEAPVLSAAWSSDGERVLTSDGDGRSLDGTARIWRPRGLASLARERQGFYHSAFIGDRGVVVAAYDDGTVRRFGADEIGEPEVLFAGRGSASTPVQADKPWVMNAALSPDGTRVAVALFNGAVRIVREGSKDELVELDGHEEAVRAAVFSPDGTRVVTVSDDKVARIRRVDGSGEPIRLSGHVDGLTSAAWDSDGTRVVTTSRDHTARIWRADGKGEPVVLAGHGGAVHAAGWSPDGKQVVTASEDSTAKLWRADSGALVGTLTEGSPVVQAVWSPDRERIATSSLRGGVRLWRADGTGEPVELEVPAPALAIAFLDSSRRLLAVTADNTTRTWTIDTGLLRQGLKDANADCLPPEMRAIYLGDAAEMARERYAACERDHRRTPLFMEVRGP